MTERPEIRHNRNVDDTLKNLAFAFLALWIVHRGLAHRAQHDAAQQMRAAFDNTGKVRATVEPRGMFGLFASDVWAVDIAGEHVRKNGSLLPFTRQPRPGWKGSIRHLRLHLTDLTLQGLPIEQLNADVPFVTFDISEALWQHRFVLRDAGVGPATGLVGVEGLRIFIARKYDQILSDVKVSFNNQKIFLSGRIKFLAGLTPFLATGRLIPRAGRYIDLTEPEIQFNNVLLAPQTAALLLKQINPVLDLERDLKLDGFLTLTDVEVGEGFLQLRGRATVPPAP